MLSQALRDRRQELALSQFQMAVKCGVSMPTICRAEGKHPWKLKAIVRRKLAKGYGFPLERFNEVAAADNGGRPPRVPVTS